MSKDRVRLDMAYEIGGVVHNDQISGHRVSASFSKKNGSIVTVYNRKGKKIKGFIYRKAMRVELTYR
jgi:hypothetical protein